MISGQVAKISAYQSKDWWFKVHPDANSMLEDVQHLLVNRNKFSQKQKTINSLLNVYQFAVKLLVQMSGENQIF